MLTSTLTQWFRSLFTSRTGAPSSKNYEENYYGFAAYDTNLNQIEPSTPGNVEVPYLTGEQKDQIRQSWAKVHENLDRVGSVAFLNLFEHKLDFKKAFVQFQDKPIDELRDSPLVKMHAMAVLHTIEQLVNRLDSPDTWTDIIDALGRRHVSFKAIPALAPDVAMYCWAAVKPILEHQGFSDPDLQDAWITLFNWLGRAVKQAIERHYKSVQK